MNIEKNQETIHLLANKRISELDGLRGIAALCVVFFHFTFRFYQKFDIQPGKDHFAFSYGKYGVELFFIISGFVIFMSIVKVKTPFEFIYKRFIRLYPTFWVCMMITFVIITLFGVDLMKVTLRDFALNFTMLPELFRVKAVDGVYWTLMIEMFFYGVILFLIIVKQTKRNVLLGFLYIAFGLVPLFVMPKLAGYYYYGTLFLTGINFYKIWSGSGNKWNHVQIILCWLLSFNPKDPELFIVTAILISIFYLFVYGKLRFLANAPMLFMGKISYALYLIHQNIGYTIQLKMIDAGYNNYFLLLLAPLTVAILLAAGVTLYVEKPLITIFSNYYKKRIAKHS